jgi:hypothetical protein
MDQRGFADLSKPSERDIRVEAAADQGIRLKQYRRRHQYFAAIACQLLQLAQGTPMVYIGGVGSSV